MQCGLGPVCSPSRGLRRLPGRRNLPLFGMNNQVNSVIERPPVGGRRGDLLAVALTPGVVTSLPWVTFRQVDHKGWRDLHLYVD